VGGIAHVELVACERVLASRLNPRPTLARTAR